MTIPTHMGQPPYSELPHLWEQLKQVTAELVWAESKLEDIDRVLTENARSTFNDDLAALLEIHLILKRKEVDV